MPIRSREIRLAERPDGAPEARHFEVAEVEVPDPGEGEILVRNVFMSVDPYMRGRMREAKSYAAPFEVGEVMTGGSVGQVVASRHPGFAEGDHVVGMQGWREHYVSDGSGQRRVDPTLGAPLSAFLGVLGMPGMTAYVGLLDIGRPEEGETVLVSAAAGAVGSVVGQIAKIKGCRAVGSAGSDEKVAHLTGELGFDAAFNYKERDLREAIAETCPDGIDVYFENVGGRMLEAALAQMRPFGRIPVCGMISQYNATEPAPGPRTLISIIPNRLRMQGFIVSDHADRMADFQRDVAGWLAEGRILYDETIVDGIENAAEAFLGLFQGENTGKMLVRLSDPDA
ncbi:MAG TPA: NADP-dependent oxidoreductase [Thermoanaerobaculia bacterium]|nr:NADP-dependent oxidoreductase [Thermoanaerobaculia bacterium]